MLTKFGFYIIVEYIVSTFIFHTGYCLEVSHAFTVQIICDLWLLWVGLPMFKCTMSMYICVCVYMHMYVCDAAVMFVLTNLSLFLVSVPEPRYTYIQVTYKCPCPGLWLSFNKVS